MARLYLSLILLVVAYPASTRAQTQAPTVCTNPPIVLNAEFTTSNENDEGSTATYTCNTGYTASGSMDKVCRAGAWTTSGPEPSCTEVKCPNPPRVTGASYRTIRGRYQVGSAVSYTCYNGYYMDGNFTDTIECQQNRTWTTPLPVCAKKDCGAPPSVVGGNVSFTTTVYLDRASYSCIEGYTLKNNGITSRSTSYSIRCQTSGLWGTAPTCEPKDCGRPSNIQNGIRISLGKFTYGESVYYNCKTGYEIQGNSTITCNARGLWSDKPTCSLVSCGKPQNVPSGTPSSLAVTTYGRAVTYSCHKGYDLVGSANSHCTSTGSWTDLPSCIIKNCRTPPAIHFGTHSWNDTTFNSRADYTCDNGYKLIGIKSLLCQDDGKWTEAPTCELPPGSEVKAPAALSSSDAREASSDNTSALTGLSIACALFAVITLLSVLIVIYKVFIAGNAVPFPIPQQRTDKLFSYASYKNGDDVVNSNV